MFDACKQIDHAVRTYATSMTTAAYGLCSRSKKASEFELEFLGLVGFGPKHSALTGCICSAACKSHQAHPLAALQHRCYTSHLQRRRRHTNSSNQTASCAASQQDKGADCTQRATRPSVFTGQNTHSSAPSQTQSVHTLCCGAWIESKFSQGPSFCSGSGPTLITIYARR